MPPEGYEEERAAEAFAAGLVARLGRERAVELVKAMRDALTTEEDAGAR